MYSTPLNTIEFRVSGKLAMFTDPLTPRGGEKCSYHIPTYEALKGIVKSIYWKPTFVWIVDEVRVMKRIRTQTKGTKPLNYGGVYPSARAAGKKQESFNTLVIYTFLTGDPDPPQMSRRSSIKCARTSNGISTDPSCKRIESMGSISRSRAGC